MTLRRRNHWRLFGGRGVVMARNLLLLMLSVCGCLLVSVEGSVDWTTQCPSNCRCTWVSGKKMAECKEADYRSIPSGLSSEVQVLDLSGNSITALTKDAFKSVGLVNLQKVFLKNCRIEKIDPDAFRDLKIMIELDLSGNSVTSLQMETFETNERLRELKLNENPLSKLTGTSFPPLMHLKLLDLSDCQLDSFNKKTFHLLTNLETLVLSGNQFKYINEDVLKPLEKLKSLSLGGNPWKCDCRLKSFRNWVIGRKLFQQTLCSEPSHLANFEWDVLQSTEFACKPEIVTLQISGKATDALLVYGDVGSDITLECLVHANPAPEVKWVRDGQVLTNSSRNQGKTYLLHISGENDRWVNLTILKSDPDDAGEYTCVGNNPGGFVEKNLTLNFQDVPTGEGVGTGVGGVGGGAYRDQSWIWILVSVIVTLIVLIVVIMLVCFCSKRRRVKTARAQDLKGTGQHVDHHLLLQSHHRNGAQQPDGSTPLLGDSYLSSSGPEGDGTSPGDMTPGSMTHLRLSGSSGNTPTAALPHDPSNSEYPDLLDLPHRSQESPAGSTASTVPDSSRLVMPQQLNPGTLAAYDPLRNSLPLNYHPLHTSRPHSPYAASVASFASEPQPVIVPPAHRPGYVTLPRRPRVPSWSPAYVPSTPLAPSPTGSASSAMPFVKVHPKYDNLGPRTTADGSSHLSLNKIGDGGNPGGHYASNGNVTSPSGVSTLGRPPVLRSTPIPSLHSPASQMHFAPIEENDGPSTPNGSGNNSFNLGGPTTPNQKHSPNNPPRLSTMPRSWKPQDTKKSAAKANAALKNKGTPTPKTSNGTLDKKKDAGNEDSNSLHPNHTGVKKVPPKPPPKPAKKSNDNSVVANNKSNDAGSSPEKGPVASQSVQSTEGDDGTEV